MTTFKIPVLFMIELNIVIYGILSYVIIYMSYELLNMVRFLAHPLFICLVLNRMP